VAARFLSVQGLPLLSHQLVGVNDVISPGERYRFRTAPGIRITTADLELDEAEQLADAIAALGRAPASTYTG
jgi:hypothetical protein